MVSPAVLTSDGNGLLMPWREPEYAAARELLREAEQANGARRLELAAAVSRFAAKAEDSELALLADETPLFLAWLTEEQASRERFFLLWHIHAMEAVSTSRGGRGGRERKNRAPPARARARCAERERA